VNYGRNAVVALVVLALVWLASWVSTNTYWADIDVPMPLRGEARTNPTYAAQRFVEALGARATRNRTLVVPPPSSVIVLSSWNWELSATRRDALERWVESGGRLVIDRSVTWREDFESWSGISYEFNKTALKADEDKQPEPCRRYREERRDGKSGDQLHWLCDFDDRFFFITTRRPAEWTLSAAETGVQVARVPVGRGEVTFINGHPFQQRAIFDGDHAWLLAREADLQRGDDVHFLSEADYPSLLALTWQRGEPVVVLTLVLVAVLLWRGAVRFGPRAAATVAARRSLAEQIRGTGSFALHHGGADSLHAAAVRALDEAARRRVAGYAHLAATPRAEALARLTNFDPGALASAIYHPRLRRPEELATTIALLETARRRLLMNTGISNGFN